MMYPFMTLPDGTEIVHSQTLPNGEVKVYAEKPDAKDCFHHATCFLPEYKWQPVSSPNTSGKMSTASRRTN